MLRNPFVQLQNQGNCNPLSYLLQANITLKEATYCHELCSSVLEAVPLETYPTESYILGEFRCSTQGFNTVLLLHS